MEAPTVIAQYEQLAHLLLESIGFGTLVGLLAKAIMPGRDPGGAVVTLLLGIGGTVIGLGTLNYFYAGQHITPISPLGLVVATSGSFLLLFFYRLFGGRWFVEGDVPPRRRPAARRPRTRRYDAAEYVDHD
jgi:uncharacterized membrane protein YeaQ/YmgE (transglycosylase-associated protein family)